MRKRRKGQQKKVNFCEVRYPKKSITSDFSLPDSVFWEVYYGMCPCGIVKQFCFELRWHAIKCLENSFIEDDEGLLHARRVLIGMWQSSNYFRSKNRLLLESEAFKKRMASLDLLSFFQKIGSLNEYEARLMRANFEYVWSILNSFKEFHKHMKFSSDCVNDADWWTALLYVDSSQKLSPCHRGWLQGLSLPEAIILVEDRVQSELNTMHTLYDTFDEECRMECVFDFYLFLVSRRDAYVKAKPTVAALDAKYGHSNFGLEIDICSLGEDKFLALYQDSKDVVENSVKEINENEFFQDFRIPLKVPLE